MDNENWFYAPAGQQTGPVTREALLQLVRSGQLQATDLVWRDGLDNWIPLQDVAELRSAPPPIANAVAPPPILPLPPLPVSYYGPVPLQPGMAAPIDPSVKWLLPVGRSGMAIAAGYLGLLSPIIFLAPIAVIISIMALNDIRANPALGGKGRAIFGLIMGGLFTVALVLFVISIFTAR